MNINLLPRLALAGVLGLSFALAAQPASARPHYYSYDRPVYRPYERHDYYRPSYVPPRVHPYSYGSYSYPSYGSYSYPSYGSYRTYDDGHKLPGSRKQRDWERNHPHRW